QHWPVGAYFLAAGLDFCGSADDQLDRRGGAINDTYSASVDQKNYPALISVPSSTQSSSHLRQHGNGSEACGTVQPAKSAKARGDRERANSRRQPRELETMMTPCGSRARSTRLALL